MKRVEISIEKLKKAKSRGFDGQEDRFISMKDIAHQPRKCIPIRNCCFGIM